MNRATVLILAAGEAIRFNGVCKQLLPAGDKTIIERIVDQVVSRSYIPYIVTCNQQIMDAMGMGYAYPFLMPSEHELTCETLLSTIEIWNERTIVLLGDVLYSTQIMDAIFRCEDPIRVFGNVSEVFAITFTKRVHSQVVRALQQAIKAYPEHPGKLRTFYKIYCGFDPGQAEKPGIPLDDQVFWYSRDWTMDVDTEEEYKNMVNELVKMGRLDK
jgi:hypothetical protein